MLSSHWTVCPSQPFSTKDNAPDWSAVQWGHRKCGAGEIWTPSKLGFISRPRNHPDYRKPLPDPSNSKLSAYQDLLAYRLFYASTRPRNLKVFFLNLKFSGSWVSSRGRYQMHTESLQPGWNQILWLAWYDLFSEDRKGGNEHFSCNLSNANHKLKCAVITGSLQKLLLLLLFTQDLVPN